jgi:hypothetical protein
MGTVNSINIQDTFYPYDPPPGFAGVTNYIDFFTGASRWGIGHFCMLRSDYDALVTVTNSSNAVTQIIINSPRQGSSIPAGSSTATDPASGTSVTLSALLAGCKAINTNLAGPLNISTGNPNDFVDVIFRDLRYTQNQTVTAAFNVQLDGFPYSGSTPLFYSETYKTGTTAYGWSDVATAVSSLSTVTSGSNALVIPTSTALPLPTWLPRNLIYDGIPWNRVVDNIAAELFLVTGYDPVNNIYSWNLPGILTSNNQKLLNTAMGFNTSYTGSYLNAGNVGERNLASLPNSYDICFESYGVNDPFTLLSSSSVGLRQYKKNVATGFTNSASAVIQPITYGNYIAIYNSTSSANTPVNKTELDAVATDIAARAALFQSQPIYQLELVGLWSFTTDGAIRGMRWISDSNGCRTILRFNNEREFSAGDEVVRASENLSNQLVVGLGSGRATNNPAGTKNFYNSGNNGAFLVSLTYASGANGTDSSPPTYQYNLLLVGSSTTIATNVPPLYRPLNAGELTGTATYGLATYLNGTAKLITAYETFSTGACA